MREEIATPLGVEDSFFMGGLSACGVETSRIAHVEHTFKIPDRSGTEFWQDGRSPSPAARASTQAAGNGGSKGRDGGGNTAAMIGFKPSAGSRQSVAGGGGVVETESLDEVVRSCRMIAPRVRHVVVCSGRLQVFLSDSKSREARIE